MNTPYSITLEYDATMATVSATVIKSETAERVTYLSISNAGPFSEKMVNLGASNYGMYECGYSGVNPDAKAIAEIDNVVLSVSYIGKLVGDLNNDCHSDFHDFAIFSEHWLECGNPFDPDCGLD